MLYNVKLIGKCSGRTIQQSFSIMDCVDGPYIFSIPLAFSRIFSIVISHCG